ncbi:hypothetical protein K2Y11_03130, partial [bacterium]|nr:hypothetical protein [bacterium]
MNSTVTKLTPVAIAILIASIGYLTGNRLSHWGARIHPVENWRGWYSSQGKKGIVRKEICPDAVGAVHLSGVAATDDVWKASIGRMVKDIVPQSLYECQLRIRGNGRNPVCLSIFDHTTQHNRLEQFFTPPLEWHDYKFVFASSESKEVGITLYVGARSIDIDVDSFTISPVTVSSVATSKDCNDQVIRNDSWSMLPVTSDGATLLPAQAGNSASDVILHLPASGGQTKSIATKVFGMEGQKDLTVQFEASSHPPTEMVSWLSDAGGNESEKQRIHLSEDIETKQYTAHFSIPSAGYRIHIQPEIPCELRIHAANVTTCPAPAIPEGSIDARLIKLVADNHTFAKSKRGTLLFVSRIL